MVRLKQFSRAQEAEAFVENIRVNAHVSTAFEVENMPPDPNDSHMLAAAVHVKPVLIASGDGRHMPALGEAREIPAVAALEAAELISHSEFELSYSPGQFKGDLSR